MLPPRSHQFVLALVLGLLAGCGTRESTDPVNNDDPPVEDDPNDPYVFVLEEENFDVQYAATTIGLTGQVLDETGSPLAGVSVSMVGWGEAAANETSQSVTGAGGVFVFSGLTRRSLLVHLQLTGFYDEFVPVDLQRPLAELSTDIGTVGMVARRPGLVRFLFGGDVMFGRRYLDRDEDGVLGEEDDLIHPGSQAEDAKALFLFMRDALSANDYTQVNLETPVIDNPATPHPKKEFSFHSHPDTLAALPYAGIDAVSLGNNHVYDYLDQGIFDTIQNVSASGVDWFGAGMNETEAAATVLYRTFSGLDFSMQGLNGIVPVRVEGWTDEDLYVAMDTPIVKGGALRLTTPNLEAYLQASAPTHLSIPIIHTGLEYGEYPTDNMRSKTVTAFENGAALVVFHHSHTLYGIATRSGGTSGIVFLGLGNLVFDQTVFETFQGAVAVVDVEQTAPATHVIHRVRMIPFHIEGFVPKLVCGAWLSRIGRHLGHVSTNLPPAANAGDPADGLVGAVVFPDVNRVVVCTDASQYDTTDSSEILALDVANGTTAPVPFQRQGGSDTLARVATSAPAACEYGRDLMHFGDFEDFVVDDAYHVGQLWNQSEVRVVVNSVVRSGVGAIALLRRDTSTSHVTTWLRNRITFPPATDLTVTGYLKGKNAGLVEIQVRWYIRDERTIISTVTEYTRAAGTYDWEPFVIDLTPPGEAGTIRVYFRHHPPASGEGNLFIDDVAIVQWEASLPDAQPGFDLPTPNNWSWLRFRPQDATLDTLGVTFTHRVYSLRPESL